MGAHIEPIWFVKTIWDHVQDGGSLCFLYGQPYMTEAAITQSLKSVYYHTTS